MAWFCTSCLYTVVASYTTNYNVDERGCRTLAAKSLMDNKVMKPGASSGPLSQFGFNALEERAYAALLRRPGQTGYKLAQSLKKPVANIYKALESLLEKGAVVVEDGNPALYSAVAVAELFDRFEGELRTRRKLALRQFGAHKPPRD